MAGASPEQFARYRDLLACFGPEPRLIGEVGQAAALKLALNQLIAAHATCFSLSLSLVQQSGINVDKFMSILAESALYAPMYAKKLPQWLSHEYKDPNFSLKTMIKDVDLIMAEAGEKRLNTKVLAAIRDVLGQCAKQGMAEMDYSAVYETIQKASS
jgi:3-hydroxyisobutyrate dehydrogenase